MSPKLDVREAPADGRPICPHCETDRKVTRVKTEELGLIARTQFLLCPHRHALLGFGSMNFR